MQEKPVPYSRQGQANFDAIFRKKARKRNPRFQANPNKSLVTPRKKGKCKCVDWGMTGHVKGCPAA